MLSLIILAVLLIPALYMLPALIAIHRGNKNQTWIFVGNLFFGWTVFTWFILLFLAIFDLE